MWVGLHRSELRHVVVELLLGDHPDVVGVIILVTTLPVTALLLSVILNQSTITSLY